MNVAMTIGTATLMAYSVALAAKSLASNIAKPIAKAFLAPIYASSTALLLVRL